VRISRRQELAHADDANLHPLRPDSACHIGLGRAAAVKHDAAVQTSAGQHIQCARRQFPREQGTLSRVPLHKARGAVVGWRAVKNFDLGQVSFQQMVQGGDNPGVVLGLEVGCASDNDDEKSVAGARS
jgi:hypothetical protein